jgi:hypothetical protein
MPIQDPRRGEAAASAAAAIVVQIPAHLKHLVAPIEKLVATLEERTKQLRRDGCSVDYAALERQFGEQAAAIESAANLCALEAVAIPAERIEVRGDLYTRVGAGLGTYRTMTGPVGLHRDIFRRVGERNGKTVDIISLRTGALGDGWLPHTAQTMAHYLQLGTSREAVQAARQVGRLPYSRASFERVPHLVGALWLEHHADIEDELIRDFVIPEGATSISVSLDRASVPMEEVVQRPRGRPRKKAPKRHVARVFHMAYCGTVTIHDKRGRALHTLRRGQMPYCDPQDLCDMLANDVLRLREKKANLPITLLADGAPEMWNLLEANFPECVFGTVYRRIDFWHVIEKLAAAAKAIGSDDASRRAMLWQWRRLLRRRTDAAATILTELQGCRREREEPNVDGRRPIHEAITYLQNNAERMCYAGAIRKGLPIGSGNVEATCKTLVGLRMKRCGSRWHNDTGNHVLHLRALALSDRWDDAMAKLSATQRTSVRRRAA